MAHLMSMNPFQPGAGLLPGYMGHREGIERPLLDIVNRLRAGQRGAVPVWHTCTGRAATARPSFYDGWPIRRNRRTGSFPSSRFVFFPNT